MSLATITGNTAQPTKIGNLILDVLVQETHKSVNRVTEYPVESGGTNSDHIAAEPREIVIEGFVTNTPVKYLAGRIGQAATGRISGNQVLTGPGVNYAEQAFKELQRMADSKELVTIVGRMRTYKNMAMIDLAIPRDRETGSAIQFTATFREVFTVESRAVTVKFPKTKEPKHQPTKDKGKQVTKGATTQAQGRVSILKRLLVN